MNKIIKKILKKLESNKYEAYIVGGYVRDKLLGLNTNDVDICTNATPKEIIKIFNLDKNTSYNYGCVNIKVKNYNIDITTFRKECDYCNRKPKSVEYINDVKVDLLRRDFTINTILLNSKGQYIDYFNGINDLKNKIIKCVGITNIKLYEDPLRILRAIRFSVIYNMKLNKDILNFIKDNKHLLYSLSTFRIKDELDKIFSSKNKIEGLNLLKELDLLKYLKINYNKVNYTNDLLGIYAQIDNDLPFLKHEQIQINNIKNILKDKKITNQTLYKYGLYTNIVSGEILGLTHKHINKLYKNLPIKSRLDIDIKYKDIVLNTKYCYNNLNEVYIFLENAILNNKIKNNKKYIIKFLKESDKVEK